MKQTATTTAAAVRREHFNYSKIDFLIVFVPEMVVLSAQRFHWVVAHCRCRTFCCFLMRVGKLRFLFSLFSVSAAAAVN